MLLSDLCHSRAVTVWPEKYGRYGTRKVDWHLLISVAISVGVTTVMQYSIDLEKRLIHLAV